jgi:phosphoglucomutase
MGKTLAAVNNTTIKVLVDLMNAAVKAYNEQIVRTQSYMIESQSSGKSSGWTEEDGEHVIKNLKAACSAVKTMTASMEKVILEAGGMQVDGDQIAINGYVGNGVAPDTT